MPKRMATPKEAHWLWRLRETLGRSTSEDEALAFLGMTGETIQHQITDTKKLVDAKNGGPYGPFVPENKRLLGVLFEVGQERSFGRV